MSTTSAALTCSDSQRIGPSFAIFPCCHMSTAMLQPPCHCRSSASATTPCWKTGFSAGYTMRTGMGTTGDVYDGSKPKDLGRLFLKFLSGNKGEGGGDHQHHSLVSNSALLIHLPLLKPFNPQSFIYFNLKEFYFNYYLSFP